MCKSRRANVQEPPGKCARPVRETTGKRARADGQTCKSRRANVQEPTGKCARAAGQMCKSRRANVQEPPGKCARAGGQMCKSRTGKGTSSSPAIGPTHPNTVTKQKTNTHRHSVKAGKERQYHPVRNPWTPREASPTPGEGNP